MRVGVGSARVRRCGVCGVTAKTSVASLSHLFRYVVNPRIKNPAQVTHGVLLSVENEGFGGLDVVGALNHVVVGEAYGRLQR